MGQPPFSEYLELARHVAKAAGQVAMRYFQEVDVEIKEDGSPVTHADRAAELVMRAQIQSAYPDHSILGEEGNPFTGTTPFQWVLDPIDGTASYSRGLPRFGTLVALLDQDTPRLGVMHFPATQETLFAETGYGCWYIKGNATPERVWTDTHVSSLQQATLSLSGVEASELRPGHWGVRCFLGPLLQTAGDVEFVGDCTQYMLVARGHLSIALDTVMQPWDSAPVIPCIREAGGCISTLQGDFEHITFGGSLVASAHRHLHEEVLNLLHKPSVG